MSTFVRLIPPLALTAIVGFGPGWFIVRRFRWTPLESVAASIGLSLVLLFVASFTAYWAGAPDWIAWAISAAAAALTAASWRDTRRLWRRAIVRRTAFALAGLVVWTVLLLSLIHQYGGGDMCCDWLEHYQRTSNFIDPLPLGFLYITRYLLPTRPPLMNVVVAHVLGLTGLNFPSYQLVAALLNVLVFLPCCLVSRLFTRNGRPADPWILAALLGANPTFFMNSTMGWTKALTAFFVVLGVALYVRGRRSGDGRRVAGGLLALAAATLTHYSAVPCAVAVAVHYLATLRPPRLRRFTRAAGLAIPAALLMAVWVGFIAVNYGIEDGLIHNANFEGQDPMSPAERLQSRALNLLDTFVPRPYAGYNGYPDDATRLRRTLDTVSTYYQGNAVLAIGSVNGVLAIVLAIGALRRMRRIRERRFWLLFAAVLLLLAPLLHGDRNPMGLAQIVTQPISYLALAFLATRLRNLPRWVRRVWLGGALADLVLGVGLAVWFETAPGPWAFTPNWDWKATYGVHFLGDYVTTPAIPIAILIVMAAAVTWRAARSIVEAPAPIGA